MHEKTFVRELADSLRAAGHWVYRLPDVPVSAMQVHPTGKLRFAVPKPCDLIGADRDGYFLAVECKLIRSRTWRPDERTTRQLRTLGDIMAGRPYALAYLALNWRYQAKRPARERVNRAFLVELDPLVGIGTITRAWTAEAMAIQGIELKRVPGGWEIPQIYA